MPDHRRRNCKACGKHSDEVGPLSWTGLCAKDSIARLEANVLGLHRKSGPEFVHWRRAMASCVGGVLLDDVLSKP